MACFSIIGFEVPDHAARELIIPNKRNEIQ
jgi:hypothetical protein